VGDTVDMIDGVVTQMFKTSPDGEPSIGPSGIIAYSWFVGGNPMPYGMVSSHIQTGLNSFAPGGDQPQWSAAPTTNPFGPAVLAEEGGTQGNVPSGSNSGTIGGPRTGQETGSNEQYNGARGGGAPTQRFQHPDVQFDLDGNVISIAGQAMAPKSMVFLKEYYFGIWLAITQGQPIQYVGAKRGEGGLGGTVLGVYSVGQPGGGAKTVVGPPGGAERRAIEERDVETLKDNDKAYDVVIGVLKAGKAAGDAADAILIVRALGKFAIVQGGKLLLSKEAIKAAAEQGDEVARMMASEAFQKALQRGAERAAKFGKNWQTASLEKAVERFAGPNATSWVTNTGKMIFENPSTGTQVIVDLGGKYFTIFQPTSIGAKTGKYLNMLGKVPAPVRRVKGGALKAVELEGDALKAETHFKF
jgi:hypothetical protein